MSSSKSDDDHEDQENFDQAKSVFAMKISNYANILLLLLKVIYSFSIVFFSF